MMDFNSKESMYLNGSNNSLNTIENIVVYQEDLSIENILDTIYEFKLECKYQLHLNKNEDSLINRFFQGSFDAYSELYNSVLCLLHIEEECWEGLDCLIYSDNEDMYINPLVLKTMKKLRK